MVARPSPGKFHLISRAKKNQGHTADFSFPHLFHPLQIIGNQQAFPGIRRSEKGFEGGQFPDRDRCLRGIGLPDLDRLDNPYSLFDQEIDFPSVASIEDMLVAPAQVIQDDVFRQPAGVLRSNWNFQKNLGIIHME